MTGPEPASPREGFALARDEREPVVMVAEAYAAAVGGDGASPYLALAAAARGGDVPDDFVESLERVCAVSLQSGRARALGRAEAERILGAVFRRTPRGRALVERTEEANRALESLADRRLRSVRATMRIPGHYVLSIEVEGVGLSVGLGPDGITVESVAAG